MPLEAKAARQSTLSDSSLSFLKYLFYHSFSRSWKGIMECLLN